MAKEKVPIVEMRGVSKRFLDVIANDQVSFKLFEGDICSLLGENGAGKTTLMNVLFGYYSHDGGDIFVKGEKVNFKSPKDAIEKGIGMVHQHFTLVPVQTVLENIMIGTNFGKGGLFLDKEAAKKKLEGIQNQFGLHVDPSAPVWTLAVGEQQKVEILKALYRDAQVLIMDEPTAVLAPTESVELFKTLKKLAKTGKSIIFISHKLHEVMEISNRVLVLRHGKITDEKQVKNTNTKELASLMVGRELLERLEKKRIKKGETILEIKDLNVKNNIGLPALVDFNLSVGQSEILGIAGVSGNGQTEFSEVLFGLRNPVSGDIKVANEKLNFGNPLETINKRIGRIPEDRITTGLFMDLSVEANLVLEWHNKDHFQNRGLIKFDNLAKYANERIKTFSIKTDGKDIPAKSLSGGNLQKIILSRALYNDPKLIVACQPTRGLDVGAMEFIHQSLLVEREKGAGVILISEDLDEIFLLSDRIVVLYEGEIMGQAATKNTTRAQVGLWMSGVVK